MTYRERYEAACIAQEIPIVEISSKTAAQLKKWDAIVSKSKYRPKVKAVRRVPAAKVPAAAKRAPVRRAPAVKPRMVWHVCKKCGLADAA